MAGKAWQKQRETVGHVHMQKAERNRCWCSAQFLLFYSAQDSCPGVVPPTVRTGLPSQLTRSRNSLIYHFNHFQVCGSMVLRISMLGNHYLYLITFGGVSFESHSVAQPSLGLLMQPKLILDSQRSSCLNFGITGMSHRVLTETNSLLVPATSTFLLSLWI